MGRSLRGDRTPLRADSRGAAADRKLSAEVVHGAGAHRSGAGRRRALRARRAHEHRHSLRNVRARGRWRVRSGARPACRARRKRQSAVSRTRSGRRTRPAMIQRSIGAVSHGILDYALAILLLVAPSVVGFAGIQAKWAYIFGGVLLVMAILTRYPLGIV